MLSKILTLKCQPYSLKKDREGTKATKRKSCGIARKSWLFQTILSKKNNIGYAIVSYLSYRTMPEKQSTAYYLIKTDMQINLIEKSSQI